MTLAAQLAAGLEELGLDLDAATRAQLLAYLRLLSRWNRIYNLTSVRDETAMVSAHLLDSLAVLPHLGPVASLADLGSGAGLPGIPLALARPQLPVSLIESRQKKASFLTQAKIELAMDNLSVHPDRAEDLSASATWQPVQAVISRAFADLAEFVRLGADLLAPGGRLLAMKGTLSAAELAAVPGGWRLSQCLPLAVPGLAAERHLLIIEKA